MTRLEKSHKANLELTYIIQSNGVNAVNCCHCGAVNFHKKIEIHEEEKPIICIGCLRDIYPNDCEDLFYNEQYLASDDLFDSPHLISQEINEIIESANEDEDPCKECERMQKEMEQHGYTFEYDLDGVPFNLRKI